MSGNVEIVKDHARFHPRVCLIQTKQPVDTGNPPHCLSESWIQLARRYDITPIHSWKHTQHSNAAGA